MYQHLDDSLWSAAFDCAALRTLRKRATRWQQDVALPRVPVEGPQEVRHVATAFNSMLTRRGEDAFHIERTMQQLREERSASEFERQRFSAMIEALHEGLVYLNPDGEVAYANPEAERLLERSSEVLSAINVPTFTGGTGHDQAEHVVGSADRGGGVGRGTYAVPFGPGACVGSKLASTS